MGGLKMETRAIRIPLNIAVLYLASERNRVFPLSWTVVPFIQSPRMAARLQRPQNANSSDTHRCSACTIVRPKKEAASLIRALSISRSFAHGRVEAICLGKHLEQSDKIEWR